MTDFKHELGDKVTLLSGETGYIMGRAQYVESQDDYFVRYTAGDGRLTEQWWKSTAFSTRLTAEDREYIADVVAASDDDVVVPPGGTVAVTGPGGGGGFDTDIDNMPWNPAYHAATKTTNADGRWKALRGHTDEAKKAREDFMSAGGAMTPPSVDDKPTPAEVVAMPAAMPVAAAAPTVAAVIDRMTSLMAAGKLAGDALGGLYTRAGIQNLQAPDVEMAASDAVRIALMTELNA